MDQARAKTETGFGREIDDFLVTVAKNIHAVKLATYLYKEKARPFSLSTIRKKLGLSKIVTNLTLLQFENQGIVKKSGRYLIRFHYVKNNRWENCIKLLCNILENPKSCADLQKRLSCDMDPPITQVQIAGRYVISD